MNGAVTSEYRCWQFTANTPNTTRFGGTDSYQTGVAVAEAVWNNPADPMERPGVVILARGDGSCFQEALIASSLIHFPRNGPVLLTEPDFLNPVVRSEIIRLCPSGKGSPAQVLTIGSLSPRIDEEVQRMGFTVCRINGGDPATTAVIIWNLLGPKCNVMLVSEEQFGDALPAGGWAAHMGDPILLTHGQQLPGVTAQAIRERQPDVYIIGGPGSISPRVEETVRHLTRGFVDRIAGPDPAATSVRFTRYQSPTGTFGWNINQKKGWSFRFSRIDSWQPAVSGNPLSHMGKHSPLLLVHPQMVPSPVAEFIGAVNPLHREPEPPFMHGFIIGNCLEVSCQVQIELDKRLETVKE